MLSQGEQIVRRARAYAAHHAATLIPHATSTPTDARLMPIAVVRRIADDMLDIAAVKGAAEEDDLLGRGWTAERLRQHAPAARDYANGVRERRI